jgi:hypothetical protein
VILALRVKKVNKAILAPRAKMAQEVIPVFKGLLALRVK